MHDTISPATDDLAAAMRQFLLDQGAGRTPATQERYARVADDLEEFLRAVDVEPWLGRQLAAHLDRERLRIGPDAFLDVLGLMSLIRVLPAFLEAPWRPPAGPQRTTHLTAVRRLMTFLRLRAKQEGCLRREDFASIERALNRVGSYRGWGADDRPVNRQGRVTCSVTLDLVEHIVDRLLEDITEGRFETLDAAIAAQINPTQETVWRAPVRHRDIGEGELRGW